MACTPSLEIRGSVHPYNFCSRFSITSNNNAYQVQIQVMLTPSNSILLVHVMRKPHSNTQGNI